MGGTAPKVRLVGACRGESRAYAKLVVGGAPADATWRAEAATSAGGRLPADVRPLPDEGGKRCLAVTLPLFECESATVEMHCEGVGGDSVVETLRFTNAGLARSSRVNALLRGALCRELRGIEGRTPDPSGATARFVQVFDDGAGGLVYRCHLAASRPVGLEDVVVRDGDGIVVDLPLRFAEPWHPAAREAAASSTDGAATGEGAGAAGFEAVVSLEAPMSATSLVVELPQGAFAAINPELAGALAGERDALMINPGIDPRYRASIDARGEGGDRPATEPVAGEDPLFSIVVPLYQTPPAFLRDMVGSVLAQTCSRWELVLVNASPDDELLRDALAAYDDPRVRVVELAGNLGIAGNTNAGVREARGSYLAFLDHDDVLDPHALEAYAAYLAEHPETDVLYCDEDSFTDQGQPCFRPLFKPDANRSLLYSHDFFLHFLTVSRRVVEEAGCADDDSSGAQDYDLILRSIEHARGVGHVPQVLYHWRVHAGSTNGGVMESKPYAEEAAIRSLERHFARRGIAVDVRDVDIPGVYCVDYRRTGREARASLVLVVREATREQAFLSALFARGSLSAPLREVVVVRAYDGDAPALPAKAAACARVVRPTGASGPASWAALANAGIEAASEPLVLVCSDALSGDVADAAAQLAGCLAREEVGAVAPRLLYPDGLVQHVGLCVREDGSLGYLNQNFAADMGGGYHGAAECSCDYSAVGPDCFMIRAVDWRAVGGIPPYGECAEVEVADFCFRLRDRGLSATVLPDATLVNCGAAVLWPGRPMPYADPEGACLRQLWERWGARYRRDALANPRVDLSSSYFRLA